MLIFGSGGHTGELLLIFKDFDFSQFETIYFLKAETDITSQQKVESFIKTNKVKIQQKQIQWIDIPRSREVKQSYISSVFTTLKALFFTLQKIIKLDIKLLVCNGPGTIVPVVFSLIFKNKFLQDKKNAQSKILFVESWCRVKSLSLSGKILYYFVDRFIVHWKQLADKYKKCEYLGKII